MLFRLFITILCLFFIEKSFSYEKYNPTKEESRKFINKCYRKLIKPSKVQEMIYITSYENKIFKARFFKERINEIFLVTDEPFRKKKQIEWVLNGVVKIGYDEINSYYKPVYCSDRSI